MRKTPRHFRLILTLAVLAVFAVRLWRWASAELWYDEAITLVNFAGAWQPRPLLDIFRDYSLANNHFLCTAIYWGWLKFVKADQASELLLRLPSLLAGFLTVFCVLRGWRRFLGTKFACLAALLFACGPVYPAFAYQIRGYVFSLLLAVLATVASADCVKESSWRNQACLAVCSLLQVFLMPSAALLAPILALTIAMTRKFAGRGWKASLLPPLPMLVATALGLGYYATLGPQLAAAAADASSIAADLWTYPGIVRHLLAASAVQFVVPLAVLAALFVFKMLTAEESRRQTWSVSNSCLPICLLLAVILGTAAALLLARFSRSLPFPRNFLLLLPPLVFAVCSLLRNAPHSQRLKLLPLALAVLLWGWAVGAIAEKRTAREVANGENPQDLLCQYYRGETSNRQLVAWFARENLLHRSILLVSTLDGPTAAWYWHQAGGEDNAVCDRFAPVNFPENPLDARLAQSPSSLRFCSARNQIEANFYGNCLQSRTLLPLEQPALPRRKLFRAL